ncbi:ComEC/Rec2 family competence protein [Streptomyces sp. NPDC005805]|uniref:ComEC/Rec2 family competence protein n=1 Tax=Streptomyces sp. NPDC005805 TaxID=3157068 RepID=UPI0033D9D40D
MNRAVPGAALRPPPAVTGARRADDGPHPPRWGGEGPADLRLVPLALAAWGAAALALGASGRATAVGVVVSVSAAGALLLAGCAGGGHRAGRDAPARALRDPGAGPRLRATAVAGVLLCAAAGATVAGLHMADLRRGPLPELARQGAVVTAEVAVRSDPRPLLPKAVGDRTAPETIVFDAEAVHVRGPHGETTGLRTPVLVLVAAAGRDSDWRSLLPSTRLRLSGSLAPPKRPDDRFAAVLRVRAGSGPRVTGPPTTAQRFAGDLRAGLREATDELPPDARALLPGLVVGDTSRMPADLQEAFEATDLTHLTAVSGSNLTIVLLLLIGPPGRALLAERGGLAARLGITLRNTALLGGGLVLAFVVVCRPEPSVLRAAACGLVTLLAIATGRRRSLLPALAAAVLLLVLYDPWLARSYGFLLSVLATGALLTLAPRWSAPLQSRGVPPRIAEALAAAAAAQAVCGPVVAVFAARVSLVAIPCNLAAELAVAPATVLGFAALAAAPVAMPVAAVIAWCAGWPAGWIAAVARTGAELPGAGLHWPGGWVGGLLLAVVTLTVVAVVRRLPRHPLAGAVCVLLLLLVVARPAPLTRVVTGWPPPDWDYVMCDVGQGDSTVVSVGEGTAVVVDAGPDPEPADRCLSELGVTSVPLLVVTHFHADHVAGLPGVLDGRSVGAIQTTHLEEPAAQAEFVDRTAARAGVEVVRAAPGERRRAGGVEWEVLWPDHRPGAVAGGANDASVTLLVRVDDGPTLLLLGDLEPPAQQALLRARPVLPRVDVLKVAHHGSAHQHAALAAVVRPRLALVSCGRDNPYGHPSPRTVGLLRSLGALVLRTDRDGSIAVTGTGSRLRAVTSRGPPRGEGP